MAQRIKILLVEDDPDDVWVMRNLLCDRWDVPFDLTRAELLASAIERCSEETFDVILLDLYEGPNAATAAFIRSRN